MIADWRHPSGLLDWAGKKKPIWAVCIKRRRRGHTILLMALPTDAGKFGWFEMTVFGKKISRTLDEAASAHLDKSAISSALEKIFDGLRLDELGFERGEFVRL